MKVLKIIGIVLLVILLSGGIYYLYSNYKNNKANASVFQAIPKDADAVFTINLEAFMKLIISNLGDVMGLAEKLGDEQRAEKFQSEVANTGINFSKKIVCFMEGDQISAMLPLLSVNDFSSYLDGMVNNGKLEKISDDEYYSRDLEAYVTFSDQLCYLSRVRRGFISTAQEFWKEIQTNPSKDISPELEKLRDAKAHFSFMMNEDEMAKRSPYFKHSPSASSHLYFEDGELKIISEAFTSSGTIEKHPFKANGSKIAEEGLVQFHSNLSFDEKDWEYWLEKGFYNQLLTELTQMSSSTSNFISKTEGQFNFVLNGLDQETIETISYEYDDNFNKIEVKDSKVINELNYIANFLLKDDFKNDSESFKIMPTQEEFITLDGNNLWLSSEQAHTHSLMASDEIISLNINIQEVNQLADQMNIPAAFRGGEVLRFFNELDFTVKMENDNRLNSELLVKTGDEEMNSLIYLVDKLLVMSR